MAALDLFTQCIDEKNLTRRLENLRGEDDFAQVSKLFPKRELSPGYYEFCLYLLWLERQIAAGVNFELQADEADGLGAIQRARQEFEREHPHCPHCGEMQPRRGLKLCASCMKEMR